MRIKRYFQSNRNLCCGFDVRQRDWPPADLHAPAIKPAAEGRWQHTRQSSGISHAYSTGAGLKEKPLATLPRLLKPYRIPVRHRLLDTDMPMDVWFKPAKVVEISGCARPPENRRNGASISALSTHAR
jgi:hypothetical protein